MTAAVKQAPTRSRATVKHAADLRARGAAWRLENHGPLGRVYLRDGKTIAAELVPVDVKVPLLEACAAAVRS